MDKVIILKRYSVNAMNPVGASWEAELDATLLRDNDIECTVSGTIVPVIHPGYAAGAPITLSILEKDFDAASALLNLDHAESVDEHEDARPQTQAENIIAKYGKTVGITVIILFLLLLLFFVI